MSRPPRVLSHTGMYHIVFRGLNRQNIFEESSDYIKMIEILKRVKEEKNFEVYSYCLMNNHVHLFIKEERYGDIKKIMHKVLTSYVGWYNRKYQRSGSLIGNRYKSEVIEDEKYAFALIRYIHQNPLESGIVEELSDYQWSSYNEYVGKYEEHGITDIEFILNIISDNRKSALNMFSKLHKEIEKEDFHISSSKKLTDEQLRRKLMNAIKGENPKDIGIKPKKDRDEILCYLRETENFTIGQLERLTGISRGIITRAYVQKQARPQ